ncbi:inositol monophosphatase [Coprothermobacteraceae bacterium]|nr:inositol monophosphatase [Coprothermobacteraceae bacterium]
MLRAAELALAEIQQQWFDHVDIEDKGVDDFVTELDRRVEIKVRDYLVKHSGYGFVGEEWGVVAGGEKQWVLDPLDGTANFSVRLPLVAVSLALMEGSKALAGVVGDVATGTLYWSDGTSFFVGNRQWSNSRSEKELDKAFVGLGTPRRDDPLFEKYGDFLGRMQVRSLRLRLLGSAALGLAYVATGALDVYVQPKFGIWDVAAGRLLVKASGGAIYQESPGAVLIAGRNEELVRQVKDAWYNIFR